MQGGCMHNANSLISTFSNSELLLAKVNNIYQLATYYEHYFELNFETKSIHSMFNQIRVKITSQTSESFSKMREIIIIRCIKHRLK